MNPKRESSRGVWGDPRIWLLVASVLAMLPACVYRIPSADLFWLLAQGRQIAQTHALPLREVFSFTALGQPWHNDQWLCALLYYGLEQLGGFTALHAFKALLLCATFAILVDTSWSLLKRNDKPLPALALPFLGLLCLAFSQGQYFFDVRAYLFTYLFLALWWRWLLLETFPRVNLAIILTAWLWANIHAGVLFGVGILFVACLGRHPSLKPRIVLLAGAVTLLNPSGWDLHLHVVRLLGSPWGKFLNEWTPLWVNPSVYGAFPLFLGVALAAAAWLWRKRELPLWESLCILAVGLLTLTGWRHVPLFAWIAIPLAAQLFANVAIPRTTRTAYAIALLLLAGRAAYTAPRYSAEQLSLVNLFFPRWAANFLEANKLGPRLYHHYGWGGYLIWRLYPDYQVGIDGRAAQVYPIEAYLDYLRAARSRDALLAYVQKYNLDTVMLSVVPGDEANRTLLDGDKDWQPIYEDDLCCIFQRKSTVRAGYVYPDSPRSLVEKARTAGEQSLDQALALDPEYPQAYFVRGWIRLSKGDDRGAADLEKALEIDPTLPNAHMNLGLFYRGKDPQRALHEIQEELKVNPGNAQAVKMLQGHR